MFLRFFHLQVQTKQTTLLNKINTSFTTRFEFWNSACQVLNSSLNSLLSNNQKLVPFMMEKGVYLYVFKHNSYLIHAWGQAQSI